ncbi:hypothetical protein D3C78_1384780 [compost metagenome]
MQAQRIQRLNKAQSLVCPEPLLEPLKRTARIMVPFSQQSLQIAAHRPRKRDAALQLRMNMERGVGQIQQLVAHHINFLCNLQSPKLAYRPQPHQIDINHKPDNQQAWSCYRHWNYRVHLLIQRN